MAELNSGQKDYDDKTDFDKRQRQAVAKGVDDAEQFANDPDNASDQPVKEQEQKGGNSGNSGNSGDSTFRLGFGKGSGKSKGFLNSTKKLGPSLGTGLALFGFGSTSILLIPAAIVIMMESIITNYGSDDSRATVMVRRAYIGSLFSKIKCTISVCDKLTKMGPEQRKLWEEKGFKIEPAPDADGKTKPTKMTFPERAGGAAVTSAGEFKAQIDTNIEALRAFNDVMNPRTATHLDENSKVRTKLLKRYGLAIDRTFAADKSTDKETRAAKTKENFDKHTGLSTGDTPTRISKIKANLMADTKFGAAINKYAGKLKRPTSIADATTVGCTGYNVVRLSVASVKMYYVKELIVFAVTLAQVATEIRTGTADPEKVEYVGDKVTAQDPDGRTATDSQLFQAALYGDWTRLEELTKLYTTWFLDTAVAGSFMLEKIENTAGGKQELRHFCQAAAATSLAGSVFCLTSPVQAALCAALIGTLIAFGDDIVKWIVDEITAGAFEMIARANLNSDLNGVALGNAIGAGIGLFLMEKSRSMAMRPANKSTGVGDIKNFYKKTNAQYYRNTTELAMYEGRLQPFDVYNKYSFAGRVATIFNPFNSRSTPFGHAANLVSAAFSPLKLIPATASAGGDYNMPNPALTSETIGHLEENLSRCEDQYVAAAGLLCEPTGEGVYVQSEDTTNLLEAITNGDAEAFEEMMNYMYSNEFIDKEGNVTGDKNPDGAEGDEEKRDWKYEYIKLKNYCYDDRTMLPGLTDKPIEGDLADGGGTESDEAYHIEARCGGNDANGEPDNDPKLKELLKYTSVYYPLCDSMYAIFEKSKGGCSAIKGTAPLAAANGTVCDLLKNPNLIFTEGTKTGLKKLCETGHATNFCGNEFTLDQNLINVLTTLSKKYKINVNNFGFKEDRWVACDNGDHPKGQGVDLNNIERLGGGGSTSFHFSSGEIPVTNEFVKDWMAALPSGIGDVGQQGCPINGSPKFEAQFPAGAPNLNGNHWFPDSCDHLHIGVRDRGGNAKRV